MSFEGVATPEAASELSGGELAIASEAAAPPPPGSYYGHEIAGWRCEDAAGGFLGAARDLEITEAGALLVVDLADGKEALVPFVWPIVVEVDRERKRIVLDPPEGLFDL